MTTPAASRAPIGPHEVVDHAIRTRQSLRAFLPTPVPRATIEEILEVASRAPSGTNTQPWKVTVLTGAARQRLTDAIRAAYDDPEQRKQHAEEYAYYPVQWVDPYLARRRKIGWDLYGLLGIGRDDKARMHEQHGRLQPLAHAHGHDVKVGDSQLLQRRAQSRHQHHFLDASTGDALHQLGNGRRLVAGRLERLMKFVRTIGKSDDHR